MTLDSFKSCRMTTDMPEQYVVSRTKRMRITYVYLNYKKMKYAKETELCRADERKTSSV